MVNIDWPTLLSESLHCYCIQLHGVWGEGIKNSYFGGMLDGERGLGLAKNEDVGAFTWGEWRYCNCVLLKLMFEKHLLVLEEVLLMATLCWVCLVWKVEENRTVNIEHIIGYLKLI